MPILEPTISAAIQAMTNNLNADVPAESRDTDAEKKFADDLAKVIADAIKSADLTIPAGTIITTGSAATQTQSVPGIVTGGLS